jgi:predicted amidophosphoribosyltransferase
LFLKIVAFAVILTEAALLVPDKWSVWLGGPGVVLVFFGLIVYFTTPGLRCPECAKSAEDFDRFCPVCDTDGLQRYQVTAAKCGACHRTLGHYKTRNYAIHFCTHCGKPLDVRGV